MLDFTFALPAVPTSPFSPWGPVLAQLLKSIAENKQRANAFNVFFSIGYNLKKLSSYNRCISGKEKF
jgi:hypothetical protein